MSGRESPSHRDWLDSECPVCHKVGVHCVPLPGHPLTTGDGDAFFHEERRPKTPSVAPDEAPSPSASTTSTAPTAASSANLARRERLPDERRSVTRVFRLPYTHKDGTQDVMKLYFTAGFYGDGRVGEIFVRADKTGTLARGVMDALATMVSVGLQYGIPVEVIVDKLRHHRFPPDGRLYYPDQKADPDFRTCTSVVDLLAQWLQARCPGAAS